jgi:hypothetical protein
MPSAEPATIPQGNRLLDSLSPVEQADLAPQLESASCGCYEVLREVFDRLV